MKNKENFFEKKPLHNPEFNWTNQNGNITIEIENKGFFNRLAQILLKKPKISYIHLDEMGSFIWPLIDGKTDIIDLGKKVNEQFGDKAEPIYDRLSQYIKTLESYKFIKF